LLATTVLALANRHLARATTLLAVGLTILIFTSPRGATYSSPCWEARSVPDRVSPSLRATTGSIERPRAGASVALIPSFAMDEFVTGRLW